MRSARRNEPIVDHCALASGPWVYVLATLVSDMILWRCQRNVQAVLHLSITYQRGNSNFLMRWQSAHIRTYFTKLEVACSENSRWGLAYNPTRSHSCCSIRHVSLSLLRFWDELTSWRVFNNRIGGIALSKLNHRAGVGHAPCSHFQG